MRRSLGHILMIAAGMYAASPCAAETIQAESQVSAVTVFADRAAITRTAFLKLPKGTHAVELAPLPARIDPNSVSARGSGKAQVTLYGVRLVTRQLEAAQHPKVKELEEAVRALTRRQQQQHNTKQVLEQERKFLASIHAASSEQISKDLVTKSPSADDAAKLLEFLDEALLKTFERDQEADHQLEALAQELDKLQRELQVLQRDRVRAESAVVVELEAHEGGAFELQVAYHLPGASWQPGYEARAGTATDRIDLVSYGLVRQQTGEDWREAQLTLSTANPARAGSMPELEPWFLAPWEPVLAKSALMSNRAPAAEMPFDAERMKQGEAMEEGRAADKREAGLAAAAVNAQGPAVTYTLQKPVTIPADWQPHRVPIGVESLQASVAYEVTPRLLPHAFLRAKVTNTTNALYLAGPVSVFLDGAFVATAALKQVAPAEEFDLYLGADERVKVERRMLKERVEVSLLPGLRGKTKSVDYAFLTTIENFTGRRISLTVFDQIPVSQREEIVVESVAQQPAEVITDEEKPGVFRWTLELAPSQKQELQLSYRVRHPVNMQVQ